MPNSIGHERQSVILADDTPEIRLLLRRILEQGARFSVVGEAGDGVEAVRLAEHYQPAGVVLDLAMPLMDGLAALPRIKAVSPETKILALSGFTAGEVGAEALRRGADAYLEKGVQPERIVGKLAELVGTAPGPASTIRQLARPEVTVEAPLAHQVELMSVLTHELRNALIVVEGFSGVLRNEMRALPPECDTFIMGEALDTILRGGQHMRRLLETLIDARRLETSSLSLHREEVDLVALVQETVADLRPLTKPHPVVVDVAGPGPRLWGDPHRLRQVLTNLLSNAAKFSALEAPIDVQVTWSGNVAEVSVTDRCAGIAPQDQGRIFQKFCRLRDDVAGMGLGLHVSRGVMLAHGGDLVLEVPEDGGCRFVASLPVPG